MVSSTEIEFNLFNQKDYNNTFFYCDKDHPFVVFTTCFCPLCEKIEEAMEFSANCYELEEVVDELTEQHQELYFKVRKYAPELLV
jgi:thiol-disulfide isomerase/thioredoxin